MLFISGTYRMIIQSNLFLNLPPLYRVLILTHKGFTWQQLIIRYCSIYNECDSELSLSVQGNCYVWALTGGGPKESSQLHPKNKILAHKRYGLCCKFSPDSQYLVTSAADHIVKVWRTVDFTLVQELTCEAQRWVWDIAFTADSQYLITASSDSTARLWSLKTGEIKREYQGHQKALTAVAFRDIHDLKPGTTSLE